MCVHSPSANHYIPKVLLILMTQSRCENYYSYSREVLLGNVNKCFDVNISRKGTHAPATCRFLVALKYHVNTKHYIVLVNLCTQIFWNLFYVIKYKIFVTPGSPGGWVLEPPGDPGAGNFF